MNEQDERARREKFNGTLITVDAHMKFPASLRIAKADQALCGNAKTATLNEITAS